jgi:hypothetical protein
MTSGPSRLERVSLEVVPTIGDVVPIELEIQVLEVDPCTYAGGNWENGAIRLVVAIDAPALVFPLVAFGHCAENPWDSSSFPEGVALENNSIVVHTSGGPDRTVEFNLGVISRPGHRLDYPVRVRYTDLG